MKNIIQTKNRKQACNTKCNVLLPFITSFQEMEHMVA